MLCELPICFNEIEQIAIKYGIDSGQYCLYCASQFFPIINELVSKYNIESTKRRAIMRRELKNITTSTIPFIESIVKYL